MRTTHNIMGIVCCLTLSLLFGGCKDSGPAVVLYVSADDYVARQIITAFEDETGILVKMVGDTEAKKTTGLIERLRAEKDNPNADVFWSSEIFMTIELAGEGIFEPYESSATEGWPEQFRDPQKHWYAFGARARVIAYAPERIPEDLLPTTWMDLTNERWKSRIVMADPRFGTTGGHLAALKLYWDRAVMPGYYAAFLEGLAANEIRLLPSGNAGVVEAIARGEADIGMTDTDDVWAANNRGLDVDLIYPNHNIEGKGIGTLLIPNTVARVKGGANPERATVFINFLLSEKVERMLAESVSHNIPIRPELSEDYNEITVEDPLRVDYHLASRMRRKAIEQAMDVLSESRD